jgi:flagellar biosynthetic protein FliQ
MSVLQVIDIGRDALILVILISGPLLLVGLVVGLMVGIFQAVTQIHEMTLTFIPKILSIIGLLLYMLPWMTTKFMDYTIRLYSQITTILK